MLNTQGLPVWKKILQCLNHRYHQMLIGEGLFDMMNNHIFQTILGLGFVSLQWLNSYWVPVLRNGLHCPWLSWEGGIWPPWLTFLLLWKQGGERGSLMGWWAEQLFQRMHFWTLQLPAALAASASSSERKYRVSFSPGLEKRGSGRIFHWLTELFPY